MSEANRELLRSSSRVWTIRLVAMLPGPIVAGCGPSADQEVGALKQPVPSPKAFIAESGRDLNTCEGVIADVVAHLDDDSKANLRKVTKERLIEYHLGWGAAIRNDYGLWSNEALRKSCARRVGKDDDIHADSASIIIMEGVWEVINAGK